MFYCGKFVPAKRIFLPAHMPGKKQSAGILLYRMKKKRPEFFLVHPGGPFFVKKDAGNWSVPKGEFDETEDPLEVAKKEFEEETGQKIEGDFFALSPVKQKGGKTVFAWAVEGEADETKIISNTFTIEWPPRSGKMKEFPEVDKGEWFDTATAKEKINPSQAALIDELVKKLESGKDPA
jgi:predicted NUDIX family NTP pyrophosphohydrolase